MTYVIIQSVLDEDFHPFIGGKISGVIGVSLDKIYNILKSRQESETKRRGNSVSVKTRIEGAIHPTQIFLQFCRLVIPRERLDRYGLKETSDISSATDTDKDTDTSASTQFEFILSLSRSFFEENKALFETLKKVFTDLYPEEVQQLERIRKEQVPNMTWYHLKATYRKHTKTKKSDKTKQTGQDRTGQSKQT